MFDSSLKGSEIEKTSAADPGKRQKRPRWPPAATAGGQGRAFLFHDAEPHLAFSQHDQALSLLCERTVMRFESQFRLEKFGIMV